jgi:O-antigen/teichoic acid export membrane protein
MSLRNKLFLDGLYTFVFRLVNVALSALLGIVTARALGPGGRGLYAMPMVDAALVSAAYAGLNTATSYFMLRRRAGRGVIAPALITVALFVALGVPASVVLARLEGAPWAALPAILSLPGTALLFVVYGYQMGINRVRMNTTYALLSTGLLFALVVVAFFTVGRQASAAIAAWVTAGNLFALAALAWMLRDARRLQTSERVPVREYASYALRIGGVSLISLLNYRADVYIVAVFAGPKVLGIYTLAVAAAEMVLQATQVTAIVSLPHIAGLESIQAAAALAARCVRNNVLISLITCAVLWVAAPPAVRLLYGPAFLPMIPAFRVLLIGVFVFSLGSPMSTYFTSRLGKPQISLGLAAISAIICIVVSVSSVPRFGMLGAAMGSTLGYIVGQGAAITAFVHMTRVSPAGMLVPRWSDVTAYIDASTSLIRRIRGLAS